MKASNNVGRAATENWVVFNSIAVAIFAGERAFIAPSIWMTARIFRAVGGAEVCKLDDPESLPRLLGCQRRWLGLFVRQDDQTMVGCGEEILAGMNVDVLAVGSTCPAAAEVAKQLSCCVLTRDTGGDGSELPLAWFSPALLSGFIGFDLKDQRLLSRPPCIGEVFRWSLAPGQPPLLPLRVRESIERSPPDGSLLSYFGGNNASFEAVTELATALEEFLPTDADKILSGHWDELAEEVPSATLTLFRASRLGRT